MRKSQRRQNPPVHGRAHRYGALNESENELDDETAVDVSHLEGGLEMGPEDTFPASDWRTGTR
jgi:hypothetical protein